MKTRTVNYFVSRKNLLAWIAVLCSVCAGVGYVAYVTCQKGTGVSGWDVCFRVVLPVFAAWMLAWTITVHGKDRIYRAAVPYWILTISLVYAIAGLGLAWYWALLLIAAAVFAAVMIHRVFSGYVRADWLIIVLAGLGLSVIVYLNNEALHGPFVWQTWLAFLPDALMLIAFVLLALALKEHENDASYYLTWGDRPDGRRIRSLEPISVVGPYIMPDRNGASNLFKSSIEITKLEKYIRQKKHEDYPGLGITELFLAAFVRTVAQYPAMNRFLSGQRVYSRGDDIQFCMVIKKEMSTEAPDTIIKLHLKPDDTLGTVYRKFHDAVEEVHKSSELDSDFDGLAAVIGAIPGVLLKFTVWALKTMDYFGLLPKFLLELSPFHGSVFFTSMGSLGIPAIYHHLYDFGNLPLFCAFGCKRREREIGENGEVLHKKYVDFSFVTDERIVDGFYYATGVKYFLKLLTHPEQLENPPAEVKHDIP